MVNQEALVMEVPTAFVENSGGFSLDWGGSAIKVLYLHKEDGEKLFKDKVKPSKIKMRLAIYSVSQSKEALSMLKNKCYIIREKEDACPLVYITGTGGSVNENTISNDLGIHNDGGYTITGTFQCGGHPFLGLGSLLCGSLKTFDELIDLAEKGDLAKVDDFFAEMLNEGKEDNYGGIVQPGFLDFPLYPLRKVSCQGPDTGRLEDRLLSLLRSACMSIAMTIINTMIIRKVKHAFLVGSFASRKLVRQLLEAEFHRQRVILGYTMNGEGLDCEIHFPKTAAYLGALGAFINHADPKQPVYK